MLHIIIIRRHACILYASNKKDTCAKRHAITLMHSCINGDTAFDSLEIIHHYNIANIICSEHVYIKTVHSL